MTMSSTTIQGADFLARQFESVRLDLLAVLDDLFGALQGGDLLEGFLHTRGDQARERIAGNIVERA